MVYQRRFHSELQCMDRGCIERKFDRNHKCMCCLQVQPHMFLRSSKERIHKVEFFHTSFLRSCVVIAPEVVVQSHQVALTTISRASSYCLPSFSIPVPPFAQVPI